MDDGAAVPAHVADAGKGSDDAAVPSGGAATAVAPSDGCSAAADRGAAGNSRAADGSSGGEASLAGGSQLRPLGGSTAAEPASQGASAAAAGSTTVACDSRAADGSSGDGSQRGPHGGESIAASASQGALAASGSSPAAEGASRGEASPASGNGLTLGPQDASPAAQGEAAQAASLFQATSSLFRTARSNFAKGQGSDTVVASEDGGGAASAAPPWAEPAPVEAELPATAAKPGGEHAPAIEVPAPTGTSAKECEPAVGADVGAVDVSTDRSIAEPVSEESSAGWSLVRASATLLNAAQSSIARARTASEPSGTAATAEEALQSVEAPVVATDGSTEPSASASSPVWDAGLAAASTEPQASAEGAAEASAASAAGWSLLRTGASLFTTPESFRSYVDSMAQEQPAAQDPLAPSQPAVPPAEGPAPADADVVDIPTPTAQEPDAEAIEGKDGGVAAKADAPKFGSKLYMAGSSLIGGAVRTNESLAPSVSLLKESAGRAGAQLLTTAASRGVQLKVSAVEAASRYRERRQTGNGSGAPNTTPDEAAASAASEAPGGTLDDAAHEVRNPTAGADATAASGDPSPASDGGDLAVALGAAPAEVEESLCGGTDATSKVLEGESSPDPACQHKAAAEPSTGVAAEPRGDDVAAAKTDGDAGGDASATKNVVVSEGSLSRGDAAKCWRCGRVIAADVAAIELHSLTCKRPETPGSCCAVAARFDEDFAPTAAGEDGISGGTPEVDGDVHAAVAPGGEDAGATAAAEDAANPGAAGLVAEAAAATLAAGGVTLGPTAPSAAEAVASAGSSLTASIGVATTVFRAVNNLRAGAASYFVREAPSKVPEEGVVTIQHIDSASASLCFDEGDGGDDDNRDADGSDTVPKLGDSKATEQNQWFLVKTPKEGVVGIKHIGSGLCLEVAHGGADTETERPEALRMGGSTVTERCKWRLTRVDEPGAAEGAVTVQNVSSNLVLGLVGDDVGLLDQDTLPASRRWWRVVLETSAPEPTPELDPLEVYSRIEGTVERLVLMMFDPVLHGIPKLGVPSVKVEARRAVGEHGSPAAAVAALRARVESEDTNDGVSQRLVQKVSELLVARFLPFVGAGAFLSYTVYNRLRLAALVAEMYGHDTEDAEVQGMLLFCVVPAGANDAEPVQAAADSNEEPAEQQPAGSSTARLARGSTLRAAKSLSHILARKVLKRATGWKSAADIYDLLAAMYSENQASADADDSSGLEGPQQATVRRAEMLFRPQTNLAARPSTIYFLCFGSALPILASLCRHSLRAGRIALKLPGGFYALLCLLAVVLSCFFLAARPLGAMAAERPELITTAVLIGHAALPLLGAFDASSLIVNGLSRQRMAGAEAERGAGLFFLLGAWSSTRLWQRCQAEQGTPTAQGRMTPVQKTLLVLVITLGSLDLLGPDGFAVHALPSFGAFQSHHLAFGLLSVFALECQLRLMALLHDRDVLLRILGATRMMTLSVALFVGGLTASVGFLVSSSEFSRYVDSLAPSPYASAVVIALRQHKSSGALAIGVAAGVLWQAPYAPAVIAAFTRVLGIALGAGSVALCAAAFEEHREVLLETSGSRFLLLLPQTSEVARLQALRMWAKMSTGATDVAIEKTATMIGKGLMNRVVNYGASFWADRSISGAVEAAETVIETVAEAEGAAH